MDLALQERGQSDSRASPRFRENVALRRLVCPTCSLLSASACLFVCLPVSVCLLVCLSMCMLVGTRPRHRPPWTSLRFLQVAGVGDTNVQERIRREADLCFA